MRAILWTTYGGPDALQLGEAERPVAAEGEILVKVHATTVTMGDCEMRSLRLPMGLGLPMRLYAGLWRPRRLEIMGQEFAGEVVEVGTGVTRFKEGDRVFGAGGFGSGTYAEYITVPDVPGDMDGPTEHMPSNMSFEEAAALPLGGLESVHFLRRANIRPGHKVLVVGAGGSIGTAGVQIAQHF